MTNKRKWRKVKEKERVKKYKLRRWNGNWKREKEGRRERRGRRKGGKEGEGGEETLSFSISLFSLSFYLFCNFFTSFLSSSSPSRLSNFLPSFFASLPLPFSLPLLLPSHFSSFFYLLSSFMFPHPFLPFPPSFHHSFLRLITATTFLPSLTPLPFLSPFPPPVPSLFNPPPALLTTWLTCNVPLTTTWQCSNGPQQSLGLYFLHRLFSSLASSCDLFWSVYINLASLCVSIFRSVYLSTYLPI